MPLRVSGLGVVRGDRRVLEGVSFEVDAGGALVLSGPNGAGKSTLLRAVAGLLPRACGQIALDGVTPDDDALRYGLGLHFVGHRDGVKGALTARDNLRFWAALLGGPGQSVDRALAALGIEALGEVPAGYLSAGQRRRLALARLALAPRRLWLLDEPAAGLDRAASAALSALIASHRGRGGMVVMASHGELPLPDARLIVLGGPP